MFQPAFSDAIRCGVRTMDVGGGAGSLPISTVTRRTRKSSVKWRIQFEIERTGQTDVVDENRRTFQGAVLTLATFDSQGSADEWMDDIASWRRTRLSVDSAGARSFDKIPT